ncbi:MAG: hypothetical protein ACUVS6_09120 [Anaerolineae bacterium]
MRRLLAVSALLVVLSALAACGGAEKTPTPAPTQPAAIAQAPAPATADATEAPRATTTVPPAPTETRRPAVTPTAAAAEEALPVPKPSALKSYVARIELKSEVTEPEPGLEMWSVIEMTYRLDPAPPAYAMTIEDKTGRAQPTMQIIVIGPDTYLKDPEGDTWTKSSAGTGLDALMQMMVDPEELTREASTDIFTLVNVVNRNEMVDGVATTHYRATEAQIRALIAKSQAEMGQDQKILSASADFWVAQKGEYLKQYRTETVHQETDGRQLKTVMQMLITNENKPVTIEPPPADKVMELGGALGAPATPGPTGQPTSPGAKAALAEPPAPPQSKEYQPAELTGATKLIVEMMATQAPVRAFLSDASLEEIRAFYQDELPKRGYQSFMEMPGEAGMVMSMYQKGEQMVIVQVAQDNETGKRLVILQAPQETP